MSRETLLVVIGIVLIVEGLPWFMSPQGAKRLLSELFRMPERALRSLGLAFMILGLLLVIVILYIFLSGRLAFWVAAGIPVSILATLGIMSMLGLSLNIISMFALIMGLGIIVDDAIVVGEQIAKLHGEEGDGTMSALDAVTRGSKMMFAPVMAASLTTGGEPRSYSTLAWAPSGSTRSRTRRSTSCSIDRQRSRSNSRIVPAISISDGMTFAAEPPSMRPKARMTGWRGSVVRCRSTGRSAATRAAA